jgi:hypothetical protein
MEGTCEEWVKASLRGAAIMWHARREGFRDQIMKMELPGLSLSEQYAGSSDLMEGTCKGWEKAGLRAAIMQHARRGGFGANKQKLSCGGSVLANKCVGGSYLGRVDIFRVG